MGLGQLVLSAASARWANYCGITYCSVSAEVLAVKDRRAWRFQSATALRTSSPTVPSCGQSQCALIVEQGKVVDLHAEAGEYTYNTGTQPC